MATEYKCMQQKRGVEADWISNDPVLKAGEIGFVTDKNYIVVGDGSTAFTGLNAMMVILDTDANLASNFPTPNDGLLLYATDTGKLYAGNGATLYPNLSPINGPKPHPLSTSVVMTAQLPLLIASWSTTGSSGPNRYGHAKFTLELGINNHAFFECLIVSSNSNAQHIAEFVVLNQFGEGSISMIDGSTASTTLLNIYYNPLNSGQTTFEGVVTQERVSIADGPYPFSWSI